MSAYLLKIFSSLRFRDSWKSLQKGSVLFINQDINRNETVGSRRFDRFLNSTAYDLEKSGVKVGFLAEPFSLLLGRQSYGNPHGMNRLGLWEFIARSIGGQRFGNWVGSVVYKRVFRKLSPLLVVTIWPSIPFVRAARKMSIPCVVLMHGKGLTFDVYGWFSRPLEDQPTHYITYDKVTYSTFSSGPSVVKTFLTRDPWNVWVQRHRTIWSDSRMPTRDVSDKQILISLGGKFGIDHGVGARFDEQAFGGLIKSCILDAISSSPENWSWLIRLHPGHHEPPHNMWHFGQLEALQSEYPSVEFEWASRLPLPLVIEQATHHVTWRSSSAYDAALLGVPTLLLATSLDGTSGGGDYFKDLIADKLAFRGTCDGSEIMKWVSETPPRCQTDAYDAGQTAISDKDAHKIIITLLTASS